MTAPTELVRAIQRHAPRDIPPAVNLLAEEIFSRYGTAVQGILFYGSCLHAGKDPDGLFDLYVLVDGYLSANRNLLQALLNKMLPPNVFYLESLLEGKRIRAKYALLSLDDLHKGTSTRWFHSYLWGRFCQPAAIVYARDDKVATRIHTAFAQAVMTFIARVLPLLPQQWTIRDLWLAGLGMTYRAEFRPERPDRQARLYEAAAEYFEEVARAALESISFRLTCTNRQGVTLYSADVDNSARFLARIAWTIRILQGKILSVLRLVKGALTFEGGVEYIAWKIERHSGVKIEVSPFLQRHPILALCVLSFRLFRRGGVR
ncbi:hypothetical protein JWG42_07700 [Desulfoprunum benzoelyticum]|uniref:Phosphatidate cytidylyltransferase n=1 Tax=Desulfoprunum benzoelyticum TaxID=1506996 RepID=A0A840UV31_9BACT|nr:hypothetical protein [Desulfoprunum benzoelyticum]MBB5348693.1 hypothetical protein [Desulfoprunum benzoelyticum]MBM9530029.1 hypothetical protein [Desulfoprunum benzoelyticum]